MKLSKREIIDHSLFIYGGLVTFALTGIALFNLKSSTSIYTLILFLPVTIYFFIKVIDTLGKYLHRSINTGRMSHPYFDHFTLRTFLNQSEISFSINLVLLSLAVTLILFRISLNILK